MNEDIKAAFNEEMRNIYNTARKQYGYSPNRFLQMIEQYGGVCAAKKLLRQTGYPEGLTRLWELEALEYSMEALVLKDPWKTLFTEEELQSAQKRLKDLGFYS